MGYYIESSESIPASIKRVAGEQTDKAVAGFLEIETPDEAIHKARKHLKKLRALMRLIRDELGEKAYKEENIFYRDLGRDLEDLRDITSLLETIGLLKNRFEDYIKPETFQPLENYLLDERAALKTKQLQNGNRIKNVILELKQSSGRIEHLPIEPDCWEEVLSSVKRVYKRGYEAYHDNLSEPTSESMHEWRKRIKYLWYHHRLLRKAWPEIMTAFRHQCKDLSDMLGDYHDLALLKNKMTDIQAQLPGETVQVLDALASKQQETLLEKSYLLGERIYAEKPKAFSRRLEHYLNPWRHERNTMTSKKEVEIAD